MALTASYARPADQWTQGYSDALGYLDDFIVGNANLSVDLQPSPLSGLLGFNGSNSFVPIGRYQGQEVYLPQGAARLQGYTGGSGADLTTFYDPSQPFSFGAYDPSAYSFPGLMRHEALHGLAFTRNQNTPWKIYSEGAGAHEHDVAPDGNHIESPGSIMSHYFRKGEVKSFTPDDLEALGKAGIPTHGNDDIWLVNGANVDGGAGNDRAIWLKPFNDYNANLQNIERLELLGDNPLTPHQQSLFKIYRAGMNREPDFGGFKFWNNTGKPLDEIARGFFHSPEFAPTAQQAGTPNYIDTLYRNILGRDPEPAGAAYWNSRTDLDGAGLLAHIADAPENQLGILGFTL